MVCLVLAGFFSSYSSSRADDIELPRPDPVYPIEISAERSWRWNQGQYEVWILQGKCTLHQGPTLAKSKEAVLWIKRSGELGDRQNLVIAYLEGAVEIEYQRAGQPYDLKDGSWYGEFFSTAPITIRTPPPNPEPTVKPPIFERAQKRRDPQASEAIRRTQIERFDSPLEAKGVTLPVGSRRLRAYARGGSKVQFKTFQDPETKEQIALITSGVNIIIDGVAPVGTLDLAADRVVIWTQGNVAPDLNGDTVQPANTPLELYLEGNVMFRQGERLVSAERVFYNVNAQTGTILQADIMTPIPTYQGLMRLRADVVRQVGPDEFVAQNTSATTSRFENPGYQIKSTEVSLKDIQEPLFNPFNGMPILDPETGEQAVSHDQRLIAKNNFIFLGPLPVFYWPRLATDLTEPSLYVDRVQYRTDKIFGNQILTRFNAYQVLGIKNKPKGTRWTFEADYFDMRGPALGTTFRYSRNDFFNLVPGPTQGYLDAWGIRDNGLDVLGSDRIGLIPETYNRGRILGRHRQELGDGWQLTGELGYISDRNFLEQYYEREWDLNKDESTGLDLKRLDGNQSYAIDADVRINQFFTETEHLPQAEHTLLGQNLLGQWLNYSEHSSLGYDRLRIQSWPDVNPVDTQKLQPLPWEVSSEGVRFITAQSLELPIQTGPIKFVPYVLGQYGHWGQDINQTALDRVYGQAGVRASVPFWRVDPTVESSLFNVHGLAHKVVLEADAYTAQANQPLTDLPLYDQLDDNSQEHFRRRMRFNTFGGTTPPQFDERSYALRSGLGSWVTNPSAEIEDTITAVRLEANQRLQTKRGPPGNQRIIDWMVFDTGVSLFPNANRDDFGAVAGLATYDYRWHVGDRLTLLSNGMFDFFSQGQKVVTVGATLTRPPRGQIYVGFYSLQGPIQSSVASAFYSYRLSPKWVTTNGFAYDFASTGFQGTQTGITRVGESFLVNVSFNLDPFKNNVGFNFMLEPRVLPRGRLGTVGGAQIPLSGISGLE